MGQIYLVIESLDTPNRHIKINEILVFEVVRCWTHFKQQNDNGFVVKQLKRTEM